LSRYEAIVLAGTGEPVTFFGYNGFSSYLLDQDQNRIEISNEKQDVVEALGYLVEVLNANSSSKIPGNILSKPGRPEIPEGELTPENICLVLAALQPENAIIVDEGITTSGAYYPLSTGLPRHSYLTTAGGSIGYGLPCALGAAVACSQRLVIKFRLMAVACIPYRLYGRPPVKG
jgi:acetolactate synthase-1/2/3 large subunit